MGQAGGQEEADGKAHRQSQEHAGEMKAYGFRVGIAHHELGDQRGDAGGKQHHIHIGSEFFPLHQAVEHHAQNAGPHIQHIDAPGGEAQGKQEGQGGHIVGRGIKNHKQRQAEKGHQAHVQEGGRIAAQGEIVGGDLVGLADDAIQPGEHLPPVWHQHCRRQKGHDKKSEQRLQKVAFGKSVDFFHGISSQLWLEMTIVKGVNNRYNWVIKYKKKR